MSMQNHDISVVVPIKNEMENIKSLIDEINKVLLAKQEFEIIYVDDGSTDQSLEKLLEQQKVNPYLRVFKHSESCGQSAALRTAIMNAKNSIIVTLDGDGQNDPADIPKLVTKLRNLHSGYAMVAGQRAKRIDSNSKKYASKIANMIRQSILKDGVQDTGCGLKVFYKEAYLKLPYFDHMHRYFPALFIREGYKIELCDVNHRSRGAGTSKYGNWDRFFVGILDLIGVFWLQKRRRLCQSIEEISN